MHIAFLYGAAPEHHKQFQKWLRSRKYKVKGKFRDGYATPHVTVWKPYEIRLNEKAYKDFILDLRQHATTCIMRVNPDPKSNMMEHMGTPLKIYGFLMKIVYRFSPLKPIDFLGDEYGTYYRKIKMLNKQNNTLAGWGYMLPIGVIADKKSECGEDWI